MRVPEVIWFGQIWLCPSEDVLVHGGADGLRFAGEDE